MRPDDLNELLHRQPFQPFRITLSNGRTYDVRHPEIAVVGRSTLFLGDHAADLPPGVFDTFHLITLLHINNVEPISLPTTPGANGPTQ